MSRQSRIKVLQNQLVWLSKTEFWNKESTIEYINNQIKELKRK